MTPNPETRLLAVLHPSAPRRAFGAGLLALLGAAILWIGATGEMTMPWRLPFAALGLAMAAGALALWRSTDERIELRPEGLYTGSGRCLAALGQIASVDRAAFAFKPSNGFAVKLRSGHPLAWAPGLYWRWGPILGIGGATSGPAARAMADILAMQLAERDGEPAGR